MMVTTINMVFVLM